MATAADAELILKLYELRREETLRKARRFMVFEFNPKTLEELRAVSRDTKSENNPCWRQMLSYLGDGGFAGAAGGARCGPVSGFERRRGF